MIAMCIQGQNFIKVYNLFLYHVKVYNKVLIATLANLFKAC